MKSLSIFLFFLIGFQNLIVAESIPFVQEEISMDGKLTESVWNELVGFSDFQNHFPLDDGLAVNQTEVKMFHDGKNLYVGAVYYDSESRNNISSLKRDEYSDGMHLSDCFGIVLDPYNEGNNGYFFAVNAGGVQFDALVGNINTINESWNAVWESRVSSQGNVKYYEIAIPLDAINFNPNQNLWGVQLYTNDTKMNLYTTLEYSPRNYRQYDLRFTKKIQIENLPNKVSNKFSVVPSVAFNYSDDKILGTDNKNFTPSLDAQYNITSSLRVDGTINPDFSQVEVDQQVTNLTRFSIFFPERRKFFLENSDLFNNLGTGRSNPFYSRRIGAETDILFGAKISGNVGQKTRIGLLKVQTKGGVNSESIKGKDYTVAVGRRNISDALTGTVFLVNNQQEAHYNRIAGTHLNIKSKNNKWISNLNYAQAFTKGEKGDNALYNMDVSYQTRAFNWNTSVGRVEENHITETGFTPLLDNFDALTGETTRESFNTVSMEMQLKHLPKESKRVDWTRRFWIENVGVLNTDGSLKDNFLFFSPFAIRFKDRSYVYASLIHRTENLTYNFDILQNGNFITPDNYKYVYGRVGYWSPTNRKIYYAVKFEYGQFYNGLRMNPWATASYRLLPRAVLSASYSMNDIDLNEKGSKTFHLARLTSEVYLNNRLNWTTYFQFNTQRDNFNINSRVQWEYKPLSYVYLVFSNNYDNQLSGKNWGVSFKVNRRLDF